MLFRPLWSTTRRRCNFNRSDFRPQFLWFSFCNQDLIPLMSDPSFWAQCASWNRSTEALPLTTHALSGTLRFILMGIKLSEWFTMPPMTKGKSKKQRKYRPKEEMSKVQSSEAVDELWEQCVGLQEKLYREPKQESLKMHKAHRLWALCELEDENQEELKGRKL